MHIIGSCTHTHTDTQSLCWPAYEIPLGLSSLLHFSPSSLTPLFILSFILHWGKRRLVTDSLLLPNDGRLSDGDYPFTVTKKTLPCCDPWPWHLWRKKGTKDGSKRRALPQTWSWRTADDAAWGSLGGVEGCEPQPLLQFSSSLSLILSLSSSGCFPSLQQALLRSKTPSPFFSSVFSSLFCP